MRIPVIRGIIDRRILVNYRVDPAVLAPLLPSPFRPKLIRGSALVGICLIRLKNVRPAFLPSWMGVSSENAAHRSAVEWDDETTSGKRVREGVYVRRRDTNSWLNSLAGGRLFPGYHYHARFDVQETTDDLAVSIASDDRVTRMSVKGHVTDSLPASSIFQSLDEASHFFQAGSLGYSATPKTSRFQGLELRCRDWHIQPLAIDDVRSSFFDDLSQFPPQSIQFDCALFMRNIEHEWHAGPDLNSDCCPSDRPSGASVDLTNESLG
ncbi:MAG: hypothetical protein FJ267_19400 [Planctomycetes bacterium]|nr:hypothetical protein [Planctomycetota bacterium]